MSDNVDQSQSGIGRADTALPVFSCLTDLLAHYARLAPEREAIVAPSRPSMTYRALIGHVDRIIDALRGRGIGRGDRVAVVLPNAPETAVALLAVAAGAVCAPLNPNLTAAEFQRYFGDLQVSALLTRADMDTAARSVANTVGIPVIDLSTDPGGAFGVMADTAMVLKSADQLAEADRPAGTDTAFVLLTSGTTSRPKVVPVTQAGVCHSARAAAVALGLGPEDRLLNVLPLFHAHGIFSGLLAALSAGSSVICTPGFDPDAFFGWLDTFRPTWYTAVPAIHRAILASARDRRPGAGGCSLRVVRSASSPLPAGVLNDLEALFGVPVIETYGMTEAASQIAANPLTLRKLNSVGRSAGAEIAIMDPAGGLLPADERGEIVLRGPAITAGYDNDAAATAGAFHNGWFRTGDLGYLDQDGYLFILGRLKDVIDRGGQKIAPAEIEDALCKHPDVVEAVAFAVPHERLGEDVAAAVVLRSGAQVTERMLQQHVREQLASYKVPRLISIVPHIPRTSGGKIQRSSLAAALSIMPETLREPAAGSDNATTATERTLLEIWADVFATDRIGLLDDFFSLGGDSLLAVQVIIRVEHAFGIKFPVRELFEMHHLRALALWIDEAKHTPAIDRVTDAIPLRSAGALSFVQENMLRSEWAVPGLPQNTLPFAFRLDGPLDVHALRQSVDELVRRHEVLRTSFGQVDGEPLVAIMPADALRAVLMVEDISAGFPAVSDASRALLQQKAALILQQESWSTIDVTRPPLFRLRVLRLAENDHVLILVLHHIICDWWSIGVFKDELSELYAALTGGRPPRLGPPGAGFSGFAAWQRDWATTEAATRQCDWWTQTLRDASPLFPHHGLHRSDLLSASVSGAYIDFPNDLVARLRAFSRSQGVTPFVTLLTAFKLMLLAKTGRDDICVGTPVANRSRLWTERLVGPVQNATIIRTRIGADLPFEEALQRVGSSVLDALTRQELPFDVLAERLAGNFGADTASLLQVVFSMRNSVHRPLRFPAVSVASFGDQYREGQPAVPLDLSWLTLTLTPVPSGISGYWRYKPDLPGTEILRDFRDQFPMVLEILIDNPRLSLSALT